MMSRNFRKFVTPSPKRHTFCTKAVVQFVTKPFIPSPKAVTSFMDDPWRDTELGKKMCQMDFSNIDFLSIVFRWKCEINLR